MPLAETAFWCTCIPMKLTSDNKIDHKETSVLLLLQLFSENDINSKVSKNCKDNNIYYENILKTRVNMIESLRILQINLNVVVAYLVT